jgi:chromosome segregation ATPase
MSELPGVFKDLLWPLEALSNIQGDVFAVRAALVDIRRDIAELKEEVVAMGEKVQAAEQRLEGDIQAVADGWAAKDALIEQLRAQVGNLSSALEQSDADKAAAVDAQAAIDDATDSDAINKGDQALQNLLNPQPSPEPSPQPQPEPAPQPQPEPAPQPPAPPADVNPPTDV